MKLDGSCVNRRMQERVQYVCEQRWPSFGMERNYFLAAIFVTCYTIPLVVISGCYALIGRRVSNRGGALGLRDGGGQTVVQRSKVLISFIHRKRFPIAAK